MPTPARNSPRCGRGSWKQVTLSDVVSSATSRAALLGALAFFITFFTLVDGPTEDSVFGYGFFVGFLALAIWSIATSIATYRVVATTDRESIATQPDS
jgi:hypothetical protein